MLENLGKVLLTVHNTCQTKSVSNEGELLATFILELKVICKSLILLLYIKKVFLFSFFLGEYEKYDR